MVSNPSKTRAIAEAKVKTDKVDSRILAQLLAADFLPPVWLPDERTRALRRQVMRRAHLVRQWTRIKNQVWKPVSKQHLRSIGAFDYPPFNVDRETVAVPASWRHSMPLASESLMITSFACAMTSGRPDAGAFQRMLFTVCLSM